MTHTSTEQERAEFEAWAAEEGLHIDRNKYGSKERYASISTQSAFRGWQAARRAQVVPKGWKLVPVEPNKEWVSALGERGLRIGTFDSSIRDILAAAPQPPASAVNESLAVDRQHARIEALEAALVEAEAGLEMATCRLSARGSAYPVYTTCEAKALEIVRQALGKSQTDHFRDAAKMMDNDRLRNLLCRMVDQLASRKKHRDGNAPGHAHSIPGVWDSDNGELAGKKCAWCEVWQEALQVHEAAQAKQGGAA